MLGAETRQDESPLLGEKPVKDSVVVKAEKVLRDIDSRPSATQLIVIPLLHFLLGVSNSLPGVASSEFMVHDLKASPATQAMMGVITGFPWCLKMVVAFTSDCVPIGGYRRKPYLYLGLFLCAIGWLVVGMAPPSVALMTGMMFLATLGQVMCGVMCDTLVVENMRHESDAQKGDLQSRAWICLFVGGIVGTFGSAVSLQYLGVSYQSMMVINAFAKLLIVPCLMYLTDARVGASQAVQPTGSVARDKFASIWDAVQENRIWMPTLFVFLFAAFPGNGSAFTNFLLGPLKFSETDLSYMIILGSVGSALGAWVYNQKLKAVGWHKLFTGAILVSIGFSLTQLILIEGVNREWGVPDLPFALGDDVVMAATQFVVQMPILVMMASICPAGVESSVFALITSAQMIGGTVGGTIGGLLTEHFGITLTDYHGLASLTLLTCLLRLGTILLLPLIPNRPPKTVDEDGAPLKQARTRAGGVLALGLVVGGIVYSITTASVHLAYGA